MNSLGRVKMVYYSCFISMCPSNSKRNPNKIFFNVPRQEDRRKQWFAVARKSNEFSKRSKFHVCADHFDLEEDMVNYRRWLLQGGSKYLKKTAIPHKFHGLPNRDKPYSIVQDDAGTGQRAPLVENILCEPSTSAFVGNEVKLAGSSTSDGNPENVAIYLPQAEPMDSAFLSENDRQNETLHDIPNEDPLNIMELRTVHTEPAEQKRSVKPKKSFVLKKIVDPTEIKLLQRKLKRPTNVRQHVDLTETEETGDNADVIEVSPDVSDTNVIVVEDSAFEDDCDSFGNFIAGELKKLPVAIARRLQADIHSLVLKARLEPVNPTEVSATSTSKQVLESAVCAAEQKSPLAAANGTVRKYTRKRSVKSDPPETPSATKRNNRSNPTDLNPLASNRLDSPNGSKSPATNRSALRDNCKDSADCGVFAEHVAEQMKTLPKETAIRLQIDFYELLKRAAGNQVYIKAEPTDEISIGIDGD